MKAADTLPPVTRDCHAASMPGVSARLHASIRLDVFCSDTPLASSARFYSR
jgi:hypothetical protein